ncbi:MAG: hypothetical protein QOE61_3045 [Micromonosporaceae bacterium]|nr:hypothetical protein [Micromonosporaceae bacterium]
MYLAKRVRITLPARHTHAMSAEGPIEPVGATALPGDYDSDPARFAANQLATRRVLAGDDVHPDVAQRLAAENCQIVIDIGGGNGTLARLLTTYGVNSVAVDRAGHVAQAPRPAIRADACQLPFPNNTFDGAAALWMLYREALTLFLRGRGLSEQHAHTAARQLDTPMTITKRGMIGWAKKTSA